MQTAARTKWMAFGIRSDNSKIVEVAARKHFHFDRDRAVETLIQVLAHAKKSVHSKQETKKNTENIVVETHLEWQQNIVGCKSILAIALSSFVCFHESQRMKKKAQKKSNAYHHIYTKLFAIHFKFKLNLISLLVFFRDLFFSSKWVGFDGKKSTKCSCS